VSALPVRLAVQTLRANLLRTVLSTLGIVMGAASMSAVLALGDGAEAFARRRIEGEGLLSILLSARTFDRIDGVRVPRSAHACRSGGHRAAGRARGRGERPGQRRHRRPDHGAGGTAAHRDRPGR
jgi:hypothetical protein